MPLVNAKDKRSCYCGSENCVETFLSGFGLVKTYIEKGGNKLPVEQLVTHAMAQQATAIEALASYQRQLAAALSVVINIVDPEVIVLGGGLSNIDSLYTAVPELWLETIFSDRVRTQLLRPLYGDSSGVRGAARLW
jgi:predicted NBD/HSP70 family sugar kinase